MKKQKVKAEKSANDIRSKMKKLQQNIVITPQITE